MCLIIAAILILNPPTRKILFPPAPLSVISATSGNLQKPKSGVVGSNDSLSGAPETHKGEAVEQEARHFVTGLGSVAVSTAIGRGSGVGGEAEVEDNDKSASAIENAAPDPTNITTESVAATSLASGENATQDPAKEPVEQAIWNKARPFMHILNDVSDAWERLSK